MQPDAVIVYDELHVIYLRDWEVRTGRWWLELKGRILNSGHLPRVGDSVAVKELHIPGRGALSGIAATVRIFDEGGHVKLKLFVDVETQGPDD